ncbi:MAG TPA: hypothetical protein VKI01_05990 [Acidimicrobiia bacterium]|nr:hypothetical protein [Acidimicrobiia bacterium]
MPLRVLLVAILVGAAVLAVGCGSSEGGDSPKAPLAFCKAASRYDDRLSRGAKLGEQVRLVQGMVDAAPAKIRPDAQRFVDALRRVETDNSVKDDPNVKRAVDNVNRFAAQACGFYEQQGGGGI